MVRLLYCLRRWPGATPDEFRQHWLEHHVERFGEPIRQIRRYVLYSAGDPQPSFPGVDRDDPYDGIASVWMDDLATLRSVMDRAMPEAGRDESLFIDHRRSVAMVVDDDVVVEPDAPAPVVLFECLARRPGTSPEAFRASWRRHAHGIRDLYERGLVQGYVQSHVRADAGGGVDRFDDLGHEDRGWDGVGAAYFDSVVKARRFLEANGGIPTGPGCPFVDHARTVAVVTRRHPRRDPVR